MKCRRGGCAETVLSWLDPHYCSAQCRTAWHPPAPTAPTRVAAAAPQLEQVDKALLLKQMPEALPARPPGATPEVVLVDEVPTAATPSRRPWWRRGRRR